MIITTLLNKPSIVGIIGDVNQAKSMLVYNIIKDLSNTKNFKFFHYGLKSKVGGIPIRSVKEMESIKDSLIIVDEFCTLFDLDNRKARRIIENTLRLINHNNNILILVGVGENFKKFISSKLSIIVYKQVSFSDLINGSNVKKIIMDYNGDEKGSELLNLPIDEALIYDGEHYHKFKVPYLKEFDTKVENVEIFTPKCAKIVVKKSKK